MHVVLRDDAIFFIDEGAVDSLCGGRGATARVLGCGGSAEVHAGTDATAWPVAVKRLYPAITEAVSVTDRDAYLRAVTANMVVGSWRDPALLRLLAIGSNVEGKVTSLVWDMADLGSLESLSCDDAWRLEALVGLFADACLSLDAMHRYVVQHMTSCRFRLLPPCIIK